MLCRNFLIGKGHTYMCTENHVCSGRIHGSQLREGANAGQHTPKLSPPPSHHCLDGEVYRGNRHYNVHEYQVVRTLARQCFTIYGIVRTIGRYMCTIGTIYLVTTQDSTRATTPPFLRHGGSRRQSGSSASASTAAAAIRATPTAAAAHHRQASEAAQHRQFDRRSGAAQLPGAL